MFSRFFIDRPIFASVLSIIITLAGGITLVNLPVAQYPEITPPTVEVSAYYPGANAQVVADTVAAPIEQQVNGVENMMYMSSQCTNDGTYTLTVTFKPGVDLNMAQVLVQNRESLAEPILPDLVKRRGVSVKKKSPSILMIINVFSPNKSRDDLYLSNYATIQIRDVLGRLDGVGDITYIGQRNYSMRVWLDPQKMSFRNLTSSDVVTAITEQNVQVAAGQIGQPPVNTGQSFQFTITALGRLSNTEQFEDMILKTDPQGGVVRMRDVAKVELGAQGYDQACTLDGQPSVALSVYQRPGSNALATAELVKNKMKELKERFPDGLDYSIVYDTTPFITESVNEVFKTLRDAVILVAFVVLLFLQNWRSALIPLVAVPVAIVGTFAVMAALGFSLNNLTLFGLVLAIGIVVDDAIVVVEAVEHHIEHGLAPRDATIKAMSQVSAPVIAVGLVLTAVFVPCAFITGITGQFYRQFALTIATSTVISAFNSLTLSPALAALLLRPRVKGVFQALPWPAFVAVGGWAGYAFLGPQLLKLSQTAGLQLDSPWVFARAGREPDRNDRRGDCGLRGQRCAQPRLRLDVLPVQPGVRRLNVALHQDGRGPLAGERPGAHRLRRSAGADVLDLHAHADRIHPRAGQGVSARQRAASRLVVAVAHAAGDEKRRAARQQARGCLAHHGDRRPIDSDECQRPQLRRHVRDARRVSPSCAARAFGAGDRRGASEQAARGDQGRAGQRLRRASGRRAGHRRRIQDRGAGPRRPGLE